MRLSSAAASGRVGRPVLPDPPGASLHLPRLTYANVIATAALGLAVGGGALAIADNSTDINACVRKPDVTHAGAVRIVDAGTVCTAGEHLLTWNQQGIQGEPGPAGSPDTPEQVLEKISQVDGQGSGLDSSFLDGI